MFCLDVHFVHLIHKTVNMEKPNIEALKDKYARPSQIKPWTYENDYEWYVLTRATLSDNVGRFMLGTLKREAPYSLNSEEKDRFIDSLIEYKKSYNYTYNKLSIEEKEFFKCMILDFLEELINNQKHSFYSKKITEVINSIKESQQKKGKTQKTLNDFIFNVNDKNEFLNDLKNTFKTEIGISIKTIVYLLDQKGIIIKQQREYNNLYLELKNHFNRNIGSYQSVQNGKDEDIQDLVIQNISKLLNPLIIKHKTN